MELEEFSKLEEKVNNLVNAIKLLRDENKILKLTIEKTKKESSHINSERSEIKKKITSLISLIDSVD